MDGLKEAQFFATFSFFLIAMAILCSVFTLASIRTNLVFFSIFLLLVPTCKLFLGSVTFFGVLMVIVGCLAASFFATAHGSTDSAKTLQHAGAGLLFVVSLLGWYIFLALVLLSVDFPYVRLPLGDLSTVVRGAGDGEGGVDEAESKV